MIKGLVSIISPCYNGAKYLPAFLESVLGQTYRPIELLFVDDGSTDNTREVFESYLNRFQESSIDTLYLYQENAGQAAAMNHALPRVKGEYLMWADSDDIILPDNVTKKVNYLENNSDKAFVLCQGDIVNSEALDISLGKLARHSSEPYDRLQLFEDLLMERNVVYGPATIMVRSSAIRIAIPTLHIYEGRQGQNWQLMLPLAYMFEYGLINESLFKYVVHNDSHSHQERTYEQEIQRADQFEELIFATIHNIPNILEIEKWERMVHIKYLRRKLVLAYLNNKVKESKTLKKELKEYDSLKITDNYYVFKMKVIMCKIKRFVNSLFRN